MNAMITSMEKADGLEAKQTAEIKWLLPVLVWVVGLERALLPAPFLYLFSVMRSYYFIMKNIYFCRKECP